jgi:hypothetical protein
MLSLVILISPFVDRRDAGRAAGWVAAKRKPGKNIVAGRRRAVSALPCANPGSHRLSPFSAFSVVKPKTVPARPGKCGAAKAILPGFRPAGALDRGIAGRD